MEMYFERASEYARVIKENIYNALFDRPSLLKLIEAKEFESCLDMGCGPGEYIKSLKLFCKNITAIDMSPDFIKMIRSNFPEVKTYVANLEQGLKQEKENSFDLVISALTIHYIEDLDKLFKEVARVLQQNGVFAFSTHHPYLDFQNSLSGNYFEREKLTQIWNTLGDKTEVKFYRRSMSETINALLQAGFVIDGYSEGNPSDKMKQISEEVYVKLTTRPQFVFIRAKKL